MNDRFKRIISILCCIACILCSACGQAAVSSTEETPYPLADDILEDIPESGTNLGDEMTGDIAEDPLPDEPVIPEGVDISEDADKVIITEVMTDNGAAAQAPDGSFCDWIELYNTSNGAVDLSGWTLSLDGGSAWAFPEGTSIAAGEYKLVFAHKHSTHPDVADFDIKGSSTVILCNRYRYEADSFACIKADDGYSLIRSENGTAVNKIPSPAAPNDRESYYALQSSKPAPQPLMISEVMVENRSCARLADGTYCDWVEIRNNSAETVTLSDYYLSDDIDDLTKWRFPNVSLAPGGVYIVYCSGEAGRSTGKETHASFSLNAVHETLFLCSFNGIIDCMEITDVPLEGSIGRYSSSAAVYYYLEPTPGRDNYTSGYTYVNDKPSADIAGGLYNGVGSVTVTLSGEGTIYYTTDGSSPRVGSNATKVYSGPLVFKKTTPLRAVVVTGDGAPSRIMTETYFINENHVLPVVSLVSDIPSKFMGGYYQSQKHIQWGGNIAMYGDSEGLMQSDCGIEMSGFTALHGPKKSFDILFRGTFGASDVVYNFFGQTESYASLTLRVSQDYPLSLFRSDLMQDLVLAAEGSLLTQHTKYIVLYINGQYWGLYAIKEDVTRNYAATELGVAKSEVILDKSPLKIASNAHREILQFADTNDLSDPEIYAQFCEIVDIDSFIDWYIYECYVSNTDINPNIKYTRSESGKWQMIFYDLDWSFGANSNGFKSNLANTQIGPVFKKLFKNPDFVDRLLSRYAELLHGPLSQEYVLERIEYYVELLRPEMPRERLRWANSSDLRGWDARVQGLRSYVGGMFIPNTIRQICKNVGASDEQMLYYFGDILEAYDALP